MSRSGRCVDRRPVETCERYFDATRPSWIPVLHDVSDAQVEEASARGTLNEGTKEVWLRTIFRWSDRNVKLKLDVPMLAIWNFDVVESLDIRTFAPLEAERVVKWRLDKLDSKT